MLALFIFPLLASYFYVMLQSLGVFACFLFFPEKSLFCSHFWKRLLLATEFYVDILFQHIEVEISCSLLAYVLASMNSYFGLLVF